MRNHRQVTEFILLGLMDNPDLQAVILLYMSPSYVLNVTGNLTIVIFTLLDSRLHTPIFPATTVTGDRTISYNCSATQLFFVILLVVTLFFLLAAMSYDCYIAIFRPLHSTTIMIPKVCSLLVLCSCLTGFLVIFPPIIPDLQQDFCGSLAIDHFCDVSPLLLHSCSHIGFLELMAFILALGKQLVTLVLVDMFYTAIASTILRLPVDLTKRVVVLNTSVTPMLKPFIYSQQNQ
ncbi:olfactory receptor 6C76-like [Tachyglossus aculeatus]|uniref:olfactory receptor 6C76-like n=1 Tax=Tachyglossus aculeatus TaxID=9261 RepID=UPI0018F5F263|nr:olfactory receptor 6C76-like [Tachyglossus aculeatus]